MGPGLTVFSKMPRFASVRSGMRYDVCMKRTTILLPDETAARVVREARRRGVSVACVVREAVEQHVPASAKGALSFFAVGEGDVDGSERVDEVVLEAMRTRSAADECS